MSFSVKQFSNVDKFVSKIKVFKNWLFFLLQKVQKRGNLPRKAFSLLLWGIIFYRVSFPYRSNFPYRGNCPYRSFLTDNKNFTLSVENIFSVLANFIYFNFVIGSL